MITHRQVVRQLMAEDPEFRRLRMQSTIRRLHERRRIAARIKRRKSEPKTEQA